MVLEEAGTYMLVLYIVGKLLLPHIMTPPIGGHPDGSSCTLRGGQDAGCERVHHVGTDPQRRHGGRGPVA